MGVELVILLNFSQNDLKKLLILQDDYKNNPKTALNYDMLDAFPIEIEDKKLSLNRLIDLNPIKSSDKLAKKGVFFHHSPSPMQGDSLNIYNHGCSVEQWEINKEQLAQNSFQIFSTGDAFSIISPKIEINGANCVIHVGLEHPTYSPLTLLQEALQLCRCAYEHGARSVTVALPEQLHPLLHFSDFNQLILSMLKASGANSVYYYDKHYNGKLDKHSAQKLMPLIVSKEANAEEYQISRKELTEYLKLSPSGFDEQIMGLLRKNKLQHTLLKSNPQAIDILKLIDSSMNEIHVPEMKAPAHVILSCSANRTFAQKIAADLKRKGENVALYFSEGSGEQARIPEGITLCGSVVTIVQSTRPNPDYPEDIVEYQKNGASSYLFEAAIIAKQARLRGAETINLINPYQFNARSDKAENNPKGKTGAYVQQNGMLFVASGVNKIITAECHDTHTMSGSYTGKKIKGTAVPALTVIATRLAQEWLGDTLHPLEGQLRLVSPDAGAAKRTKELTDILQNVIGDKLCQARVLGEKQRDSHLDTSAVISNLNAGSIGFNPQDKYVITDDETATGSTLCQAVEGLVKNGAKDISVIVVHNNMPLDWLTRQLCLARFFHIGVNDLHFSDTHEMGYLAKNYEDMIQHEMAQTGRSEKQIEEQVYAWFQKNMSKAEGEKVEDEFLSFKTTIKLISTKTRVHSLANEFADRLIAPVPKLNNCDSLKTESSLDNYSKFFYTAPSIQQSSPTLIHQLG